MNDPARVQCEEIDCATVSVEASLRANQGGNLFAEHLNIVNV